MACQEQDEQPSYSTAAEIRYLDRLDIYKSEKPYEVTFHPVNTNVPGARRTNFSMTYWPMVCRDMSSRRQDFSTDVQGFELVPFKTQLSTVQLKDVETVEAIYYEEARIFLRNKFNATTVRIFDTTIREAKSTRSDQSSVLSNNSILVPAMDCHVDQSPDSIRRRVEHLFPDGSVELLKQRLRVINIWRPLVWPCSTAPLAMCDWRSSKPRDFTAADHMTPNWLGESLQLHHSLDHEWWFARDMHEEDVLLLKMYDSDAEKTGSGIAQCTPHSAFAWKDAPGGSPERQSMEIRAIVFSESAVDEAASKS